MSPARYLARHDYDGLRSAFRGLVRLAGGARAAEQISRVSHQALDRYGSVNPDHADRFAPVDVIADLEAECGEPIVSRMLAEMSGHVLVHLPVVPGSNAELDQITGEALTEIGDVFLTLGKARADNAISGGEAEDLHGHIRDAIVMLLKLDRQVEADATRDGEERL